jgi:hypothetical protein
MNVEAEKRPSLLVGTVRRFGTNGTLYEVLRQVDDTSVLIHVLDTQEETRYPIAAALRDPDQ